VGAVPRKLSADVYRYEFFLVLAWGSHPEVFTNILDTPCIFSLKERPPVYPSIQDGSSNYSVSYFRRVILERTFEVPLIR
jgi:hypothetical protein